MKKIVSGLELQNKMEEAVNLLCNTVKTTLGPKGSNVIIDHSAFSPFITNDGVTIAENIESEDEVINTILELVKEASIKTNLTVGDGTTTTLVLLQSIFNKGLNEIKTGQNPIIIKKIIKNDLKMILEKLSIKSKKPTKKDLEKIAITAANSKEVGQIISKAYNKVLQKEAIIINEGESTETIVTYQNGYSFDTILASPYFLNDKILLELNNCHLLLANSFLTNMEEIAPYINESLILNKDLVIIAEDYDDNLINNILSFNRTEKINILLLKTPEYGKNKQDILTDFEIISNGKIIDNFSVYNFNNLGIIKKLEIKPTVSTIYFDKNTKIESKIVELNTLKKKNMQQEFINKRIAMLKTGIVNISVGGITKIERREKKMRFDDALCAIATANNGILPGSGLSLYQIADEIEKANIKSSFLIETLKEPFRQILFNSGVEETKIIKQIKLNNYQEIYNALTNKFENIKDTVVLDSLNVVTKTLENSVSVASILLTTTSLIINEYQNNAYKVNDFTDL